jgi:hypothetical protein
LLQEYVKKAFEITGWLIMPSLIFGWILRAILFYRLNSNPAFGPKELDCALLIILDIYDVTFIEILKTFDEYLVRCSR